MLKTALLLVPLASIACGKDKAASEQAPPAPTTPAAPAPAASAAPAAAAPVDPFAMGSCEYTIDGGEPLKGGGGISNVMSIHWMAANQPGRSIAGPLLINCGPAGKQLNLSADDTSIAMAPKKYEIGTGKAFSVMGPGLAAAKGEIDISAWDKAHVTGTFTIEGDGKKVAGKFDIKCPQPGNGICE